MEFDWDAENIAHIARHGLKPDQVETVFRNAPVEFEIQYVNGEEREVIIGPDFSGKFIYVVWTERYGKIRVCTAYPATEDHVEFYFENR